jgi:hypothetical protein
MILARLDLTASTPDCPGWSGRLESGNDAEYLERPRHRTRL